MYKKKTVALVLISSLLVLGVFFVIWKLDFNGRKEILIKNEKENKSQEITKEMKNDSDGITEISEEKEIIDNYNKADDVEESGSKEENIENPTKFINKLVSWGYQKSSERSIDTIIIHSSYNALGGDQYDTEKLIEEYKEYGVSPHYLINRSGNIYRLVEDRNIAYHAGESKTPDGRTNVNNFSIGIEMMNTKSDKYTSDQYSSLKYILAYLKDKYKIKYTLGHNDIAKGRKDDPWNFEWNKVK